MKKKLLLLFFIISFIFRANAQNSGKIEGNVLNEAGQPLAGVNVELKELKLHVSTDDRGLFHFNNLQPGTYTILSSHIGYNTYTRSVSLKEGQRLTVNIVCSNNQVQLETVTVTAEKRENLLQKVPMAVSALGGTQIRERNIREMGDLVLSVPNLISMNAGSPTLSTIAIRGILTFSYDPVVGVYVDGVPMFDGYSTSQQFQDIERVEVLRGPQSTLYGRNGLGGVINIITRKPGNTLRGFAEAGIGNYNSRRFNLGISGPLIKDKLFMGISGLYDTHYGYFTNEYTHSRFDKPKTYNGNFYLKYLASPKLSFTLNAKGEYNDISGVFPYAVNAAAALQKPYTINQDGTNVEKRKLFTASLNGLYNFKGGQLSSITGYTYLSDIYENYDVDYGSSNAILFEVPRAPQRTLTQEFKIVTEQANKLKFTGGIFGFIDRKESQNSYIYGPDAAAFDPRAPYRSNIYADKKIYGIAGYGNMNYAFADKWELTVGLRYDYERRNMLYSSDFYKAPGPATVVAAPKKIYGHNGAFSPKLSLSYAAQPDLLFYTTYSRGYRSGGFNPYTADVNRLNYKPEYTDNYEAGVKSEWLDKRLRANASIFYTHWKDQQQILNLPEVVTDNVGELTSKGGELELTGIVLKGLEVNYNLGIVQTNYKSLLLPDANGQNKNYTGNKQIFTPSFTSAFSFTYRKDIGNQNSIYLVPEWKYFGKQYMTYYNDLEQKPFSLINASAGFRHKSVELSIWAKNIGKAQYLSFAYATQMAASSPVLLGNPRTFGTSIKVRF